MPATTFVAPMYEKPQPLPQQIIYSSVPTPEDTARAIQELLDKVNELTYDIQLLHAVIAELREVIIDLP